MRTIASRRTERGDTLIEVILSVAVLSLATVLTMALVNHSHRNLLSAINRESVRSYINTQIELLQYYHDMAVRLGGTVPANPCNRTADGQPLPSEAQVWACIESKSRDIEDLEDQVDVCNYGTKPFFIDITTDPQKPIREPDDMVGEDRVFQSGDDPRNPGGWIAKPGYGLWINAIERDLEDLNNPLPYYDFYIKACWTAPDMGRHEETSTLVRINKYE
jgi:hypothetical protein